jgi:sugar (pentulose or hexulose) kinase
MTTYTLGVDIGTFESKGVLVDDGRNIVAQAARPHQMIVPQARLGRASVRRKIGGAILCSHHHGADRRQRR